MMPLINTNKIAFYLVVLVIVSLLVVLVFSVVAQGAGLEFFDASMMRYCESSGGVCTGI